MKYYFDLETVNERKRSRNVQIKIKAFIILAIILIILAVLAGMKAANYYQNRKYAQELEEQKQEIAKQEEELERQREAAKLKNLQELTEEQIQTVENIYKTEEKQVFLTFDDGPTASVTPYILDLLKQENIKATFFVLGNRVTANPDLIKREFEEGHYIANHGHTHKYSLIYQNSQTVLEEYNYTESCIQEALENPNYHSRIFRFPGGSAGGYYKDIKSEAKQFLRDNHIASLDWNSLSKDADGAKTKEALLQNIINTTGEKQSVVVLMHDASDKILTYETLPDVIKFFRDNGYTFKTLYDIL